MSFMALAKHRISSHIITRPFASNPHMIGFFSSTSKNQNPDLKTPSFIVNDYLVSSFGFSPTKAAAISKPIAHLKLPDNPEAVRHFLEHHGFNESQIKTVIARCPRILCSRLEKTVCPNLRALHNAGLSISSLNQIILSGPHALQCSEAVPRINFWRDFVAGDEAALVKVFKRNRGLVCHDINLGIAKKLSMFKCHGISTQDIRRILLAPRLIISSVSTIEDALKRVKELGFRPESGMFVPALQCILFISRETFQKKMDLLRSYGFSEEDFFSALHKCPDMIKLSEENLHAKMAFLLREVRCGISYIALHPTLLNRSLEKRLRPRHHVLHLLELKGLSKKRINFLSDILLTDIKFVERYILPHKDTVPELHETYLAACASGSG